MKKLINLAAPYLLGLCLTACLGKVAGAPDGHFAPDGNVDTTCLAYTNFTVGDGTNPSLQSKIYSSCQTCHGMGGGAGAAMYTIQGPNPSDSQLVANYIQARGRMNYAADADPSQSDLIQYGRGYKSHTGGAAFTLDDELALTNWAADLTACGGATATPTP